MKFAERVRLYKSLDDPNAVTVPAEVLGQRGGRSIIDDQRAVAGGSVDFYVRNTPHLKDFRLKAVGYRAEFQRWNKGVSYSVNSVDVENNGRWLLVSCART